MLWLRHKNPPQNAPHALVNQTIMDATLVQILIIFLLLVINGIFAMSEIALVSARKARLQQSAEEGQSGAMAALQLSENPNRLLSTVQIGITLVGIFSGALGGATIAQSLALLLQKIPWLANISQGLALAIVVLLTTYFSLVIGELIPKRLALNNPERIAIIVAQPMRALAWLTAPIVSLLSKSTDFGLRLLGTHPSQEPPVTEEEIKVLMEQGTQVGVFETAEQDMITGVFRLGDRYIDSVMTPRTEIEWLDLDEPFEELRQTVLNSGHTRFPVAQGTLDNVQGILLARDFLSHCLGDHPVEIKTMLQPPIFVPDSMSILKVLAMIKEAGVHVALVIDEYGGLLGMVTLYDILEAIVGEIRPEGDEEEQQAVQREDGSWLLDGLISIDEFKDIFNLREMPDEERIGYQTLGGFIMTQIGAIPTAGQHFEWQNLRFEVMDMDGRRVDKVLVSPILRNEQSV